MKIILNEAQYDTIVLSEALNESKDIYDLIDNVIYWVGMGAVLVDTAVAIIYALNIPTEQKEEIRKEIVMTAKKRDNSDVLKDTVTLAPKMIDASDDEWRCISFHGIVTVYNAVEAQCNADVEHTASGFKLDLKHPEAHRIVAMDREFMKYHGIHFGDIIRIDGTHNGAQDGIYQVQDLLNKRYEMQPKVDVLTDNETKYGGTTKDNARIFVLKKRSNRTKYNVNFKNSLK